MKASDLVASIDILKKIEAKEQSLAEFVETKQKEIDDLKKSLPVSLRSLLAENGKPRAESSGERIRLSNDDKAAIRTTAKEVLKKAKDGMKFGEISKAVQEHIPVKF